MLCCTAAERADNRAENCVPIPQAVVVRLASPPKHKLLCPGAVSGAAQAALSGHGLPDYAGRGWRQCWQPVCHQSHQGLGRHALTLQYINSHECTLLLPLYLSLFLRHFPGLHLIIVPGRSGYWHNQDNMAISQENSHSASIHSIAPWWRLVRYPRSFEPPPDVAGTHRRPVTDCLTAACSWGFYQSVPHRWKP